MNWRDRFLRSGWPRRALIAMGVALVLAVLIRILLDPIASHFTRQGLNKSKAIRGDFEKVHCTVFPPGYEIWNLKIIEEEKGDWRYPLFYAERAKVTVDWRRLFAAKLAVRMRLENPKIVFHFRPSAPKRKKTEIPNVRTALQQMIPARLVRVEILDGEFLFRDLTTPGHPEIWMHHMELAVENLGTREELVKGQPATLSARATLGRSGSVTFFISADPFERKPTFEGNLALRGWKLAELYALEAPKTKLHTPEGTLDLFVKFKARDGLISGGIKPVLKNVEVRPTEDGMGNRLKAWVADKGLDLFSDRVPDRNAVATIIPITGRLDQPDIQLWPTVLGVIRNAFVEGIASGFKNLPPPVAETKEGKLEQAIQALKPNAGPPKAQPEGEGEK